MKPIIPITIILTCFLSIVSCNHGKKKIQKVNPQFSRYISGFTSGMVRNTETIKIELADQYGNPGGMDSSKSLYDIPDSSVLTDIFISEPEIKGKVRWLNRRVIEFIPEEKLDPDVLYNVQFKLSELYKTESSLENFQFQVAAFPQHVYLNLSGLQTINSYQTEWMKMNGKIRTADAADKEKIKEVVTAKIGNKELRIKWLETYSDHIFSFYIDSIKREEASKVIVFEYDGKEVMSKDKGSIEVKVPSIRDFNVSNLRVVDEEDQILEITFSDPLLYRQDLNGIINLKGLKNLKYKVEGNVARVFIDGRVEGFYELNITTGIKNYKEFNMREAYTGNIEFEARKPAVRLVGNGNILPNSGGLIFPFEAVALKKVDVRVLKIKEMNVHQFLQVNNLDGNDELGRIAVKIAEKTISIEDPKLNPKVWNTHVIDLSKLILPEPGAIYRVSIKFKPEYTTCDCIHNENNITTGNPEKDNWNENNWNSYAFDDGYQQWNSYYSESSPCSNQYYYGRAVNRNIIASDLGMIYKLDEDKNASVFITDMISSAPLADCRVDFFNYAKKTIATVHTDAYGMAMLKLKEKPFLMTASFKGQKGYMKLGNAYSNSLSKFDVSGEQIQKGVKGMIYTERGVWRPGDSIYLNFILEDRKNAIPDDYPIVFELYNPDGALVAKRTNHSGVNGFYDLRTSTSEDAMTGKYLAKVLAGNNVYTHSLHIETVKPNRLKIDMKLKPVISKRDKDSIGDLSVCWLHGTPVSNLNTTIDVRFQKMRTAFNNYKNYHFDSPLKQYHSEELRWSNSSLDKNGRMKLTQTTEVGNGASGLLRADFVTRVFEKGGDFSIDKYSTTYSPYEKYLGIKMQKSGNQRLEILPGRTHKFEFAAVDASGNATALNQMNVKIFKLHRWWWYEEENNLSDYMSRNGVNLILDTMINTEKSNAGLDFFFMDDEYGRFLIIATDPEGGHQSGVIADINGYGRRSESGTENAKMLNFTTSKSEYNVGEKIVIEIPSSESTHALISIERSDKILNRFWKKTGKGETKVEVTVTKEMTPNVYVHVSLIQPHKNTKNDMPIRLYGIVPVKIIDKQTVLEPVLACNESWLPDNREWVNISEKNGQAMTYTLAVVDEGLLSLSSFKTPQPWDVFYAKQALGVKTWDMYDQVIGAFAGKIDKLLSIGGDGELSKSKTVKANRFKPMVRFMGPFKLKKGQKAKHLIDIPSYIGAVRVMVIAGENGAYGSADKNIQVKKDLMVLPTLPRVVGPGETISMPVNVFVMNKNIRNVNVKVSCNNKIMIDGDANQNIHFDAEGDKYLNFTLKVPEITGIAKISVSAESKGIKSKYDVEIDVRAPNPLVSNAMLSEIEPGKSIDNKIVFEGIQGTNYVKAEISNVPHLNLSSRLDELIHYPHGCLEQTTSAAFPQLFVGSVMYLSKQQKDAISVNIKAAISRLTHFQNSSGGFSYWPGESYVSHWGTNYAVKFLLEAENKGYVLPSGMKTRFLEFLRREALLWAPKVGEAYAYSAYNDQLMQSNRLYVLALSGHAELGAMNRMLETPNLKDISKWHLAAAYHVAGHKEFASTLTKNLSINMESYRDLTYNFGSDFRDECLILEMFGVMERRVELSNILLSRIAGKLSSRSWYSTQETSSALLAICKYLELKNEESKLYFDYSVDGKPANINLDHGLVYTLERTDSEIKSGSKINIKNTGKGKLFIKWTVSGIPMQSDMTEVSQGLKMNVIYRDLEGKVIDIKKLKQGTDFYADIEIANKSGNRYLDELALTQVFPSGWELRNSRMEFGSDISEARYRDFRDDRVHSYYRLKRNQTIKFRVMLNASYAGKFYLPTLYTEAMYDQSIQARIPGKWVEVYASDLE